MGPNLVKALAAAEYLGFRPSDPALAPFIVLSPEPLHGSARRRHIAGGFL